MRAILRPLPRSLTRPLAVLVLVSWAGAMAALIHQSYFKASPVSLATDLARYGSTATWRGVYYRGEKIGFTVSQTVATDDGFALEESGRLQMSLLGATTAATIRTTAHVDAGFALRSFEFSLDPGTGAIEVRGRVSGRHLTLDIKTAAGVRTEERELEEPPALAQNMARRLADGGLVPGTRHRWTIFDPATLRNAPVTVIVGHREVVRAGATPIPAFKVDMEFAGLHTTSWITDTGEVVREESPLGLITVRETPESARAMAVSGRMRVDLLEASSVVPRSQQPIGEPRDVRRMRLRLEGVDLAAAGLDALSGGAQQLDGDIVDLRDPETLAAQRGDPDAARHLGAEALIESDAPEIVAEAEAAVRGVTGDRARAERLVRHVNGLLEKKPTVSLPSARETLRTKVGDCNEHTALYVAMARALGLPARIAVGLVYTHGAFYYHAWPEVYLEDSSERTRREERSSQDPPEATRRAGLSAEDRSGQAPGGRGLGLWLPVDPTLNQFPADTTHLRLARGGLDKQAAIIPLIGRLKMTVLDVEMAPNTMPILVGRETADLGVVAVPLARPDRRRCPCPEGQP
jgi:transglutaminase-like putative cysteine protease